LLFLFRNDSPFHFPIYVSFQRRLSLGSTEEEEEEYLNINSSAGFFRQVQDAFTLPVKDSHRLYFAAKGVHEDCIADVTVWEGWRYFDMSLLFISLAGVSGDWIVFHFAFHSLMTLRRIRHFFPSVRCWVDVEKHRWIGVVLVWFV
jgi:hypothetical protein